MLRRDRRASTSQPCQVCGAGDELSKTLSVGVFTELVRGDIYFWGSLMAACLAGSIPIIVVYTFFMDYYVSGLTAGAIK